MERQKDRFWIAPGTLEEINFHLEFEKFELRFNTNAAKDLQFFLTIQRR